MYFNLYRYYAYIIKFSYTTFWITRIFTEICRNIDTNCICIRRRLSIPEHAWTEAVTCYFLKKCMSLSHSSICFLLFLWPIMYPKKGYIKWLLTCRPQILLNNVRTQCRPSVHNCIYILPIDYLLIAYDVAIDN